MIFKKLFEPNSGKPGSVSEQPQSDQGIPDSFAAALAAIDRAAQEHQQQVERRQNSEDRRKSDSETRPKEAPERRRGDDRRTPLQTHGFGKRGASS